MDLLYNKDNKYIQHISRTFFFFTVGLKGALDGPPEPPG